MKPTALSPPRPSSACSSPPAAAMMTKKRMKNATPMMTLSRMRASSR
jgi:hypothetical protein